MTEAAVRVVLPVFPGGSVTIYTSKVFHRERVDTQTLYTSLLREYSPSNLTCTYGSDLSVFNKIREAKQSHQDIINPD